MADYCTEWWHYDCPLCEKEDVEEVGLWEVRIYANQGHKGKYRGGKKVTPDDPPYITDIELREGWPCGHSEQEVHDTLRGDIENDFAGINERFLISIV